MSVSNLKLIELVNLTLPHECHVDIWKCNIFPYPKPKLCFLKEEKKMLIRRFALISTYCEGEIKEFLFCFVDLN